MTPHTWGYLGDTVNDATHQMYYRGQRIREAYYRGERIWGLKRFLGIIVIRPPDKIHYPEIQNETLRRIAVTETPEKRTYSPGEEFDFSGAVVTAFYADNTSADVTNDCVFIPFDEENPFEGLMPSDIPSITNDRLDYSGIRVFGIWSGHRTEDITERCEFYPPEGSLINPATIMTGIFIERLPNKTTYSSGEHLDYSGLVVKASYADGHEVDVTSECAFSPLSGESSDKNRIRMKQLVMTKLPRKQLLSPGEPVSYDGTEIRAIYSNGLSLNVTSDCVFDPPESVSEEGGK